MLSIQEEQTVVAVCTTLCAVMMAYQHLRQGQPPDAALDAQAVGMLLVGCMAVVSVVDAAELRQRRSRQYLESLTEVVFTDFWNRNNKKKRKREGDVALPEGKTRRDTNHQHDRAYNNIQADYFAHESVFTDRQFEEVFRLTKGHVERLIQACCKHSPTHFLPGKDAIGKAGIHVQVKVLAVLKIVAFGCSGRAFRDYHQMATNTSSETLKAFFRAILSDDDLRSSYLRAPTKADVQRVCALHERKHGVAGLLMSLDCLHIMWKNCPVALQGHFKNGKNKFSSIVLEGGVDYNTWFWHASVGHAGTLNDINIWDRSPLLDAFLSEPWHRNIDFRFSINGTWFDKVWVLVDGIYPEIARFVKTISQPFGHVMCRFAKWQESCRKDSERAFGILVRKFQMLARPIEYWDIEDLKRITYGCVLMHNMMVSTRIGREEEEAENLYAVDSRSGMEIDDSTVVDDHDNLRAYVAAGSAARGLRADPENLQQHVENQKQRWGELYNKEGHYRLQTAVMNQVSVNYLADEAKREAARAEAARADGH